MGQLLGLISGRVVVLEMSVKCFRMPSHTWHFC